MPDRKRAPAKWNYLGDATDDVIGLVTHCQTLLLLLLLGTFDVSKRNNPSCDNPKKETTSFSSLLFSISRVPFGRDTVERLTIEKEMTGRHGGNEHEFNQENRTIQKE